MKRFDLHNDPKIETGFKIPADYFAQFENKIMNQLPEKEVKVISIFNKRKIGLSAIAAVFALGIGISTYLNYATTDNIKTEDYLASEMTITTEDIIENLSDEDITSIEENLDLYDQDTKTYAKDYLY